MSDNTTAQRWIQARKEALKMAGVPYSDNATSEELAELCKKHSIKATLADPNKDQPSEADELKERIARLEQMIQDGFKAPKEGAGAEAAAIAQAVAAAVKKEMTPEKDSQGFVDPSYIDPEDRLERPVVFFSWRHWNYITFSMKHGVAEKPPMGPVEFIVDSGRWVREGNETLAHYVCKAEVYSKKQAEWLRNHEWHGVRFFSSLDALNSSAGEGWARVAQKWATALASKKPQELLALAAKNNMSISINEDTDNLRMRLIGKLAEGEMEQIRIIQERVALQGSQKQEKVGTI